MASPNAQRLDIQFLRALAVLAVIGYHFGIVGLGGGFVGVDIFFVISGYLIFGHIHAQFLQETFSLRKFFGARLRRIFPALAFMCVATALWGWFYILPREYVAFSRTLAAALFFVSNFAFMGQQGYFDAAPFTKPLLHTWSLSIEGQFYFFLPFILIALFRAKQGKHIRPALVLAGFASAAWMLWLAYGAPASGFYDVGARAWEFAAGALCTTFKFRPVNSGKPLLAACAAALLFSIVFLKGGPTWPNAWLLIPIVATAAFIYLGEGAQDNPVIANPVLQRIGDMSYSLYLWHWPVWTSARLIEGAEPPLAGKAALLLLTFVLAYASWRWVETPFRSRQRVGTRRMAAATLAALFCSLALLAFVVASKGYADRFPAYVARAAVQGLEKTPRGECFRHENNAHEAPGEFCAYGASSDAQDATAILWGDSHANMYLTPLSDASAALGQTGLIATMTGCRAFVESDTIRHPDYPNCEAFNREVYAYLGAHPKIRTVVLGLFWSDSDDEIARTAELAHALIAQGRRVVLIGPIPLPGMDVQVDWAMRQIRAGHPIDEIRVSRASEPWLNAVSAKVAGRFRQDIENGSLYLLDPTEQLCDGDACYVVKSGVANFCDTSHLTEIAARNMQPLFQAALLRTAQQKPRG